MNRRSLIALALTAAAVAFAVARTTTREPPSPPQSSSYGAPAAGATAEPAAAAAASPSPHPEAPAIEPRALSAGNGAALREEADRLIAEGEVLEGLEVFRQAVEAAPTAQNHGDLGGLLYRLTAYDEAAIHLRAAAELDPENADRWIALANVYYRKIDPGEAWKAEKRAREAEPGLELARDGSGMRVRKGDKAPRQP